MSEKRSPPSEAFPMLELTQRALTFIPLPLIIIIRPFCCQMCSRGAEVMDVILIIELLMLQLYQREVKVQVWTSQICRRPFSPPSSSLRGLGGFPTLTC